MAVEIERKFLVKDDRWRSSNKGILYRQGYLSSDKNRVVRVRCAGSQAFLTVKGPNKGARRLEFEYEIPLNDANELLETLCIRPFIEKYRFKIEYANLLWEIDEFIGENAGLVLAEVELAESVQKIELPDWIGAEVTGDAKYYNVSLVAKPFKHW
jgi:CYTH domain-containing protein